MKKRLLLIAVILIGLGAINAQKVTSKARKIEVTKSAPHPHSWDMKLGGSIISDREGWIQATYDVSLRYIRQFVDSYNGGYWGAQIGSTTYLLKGYSYEFYQDHIPSIYAGLQIGWKKGLGINKVFDIDLAANYQFGFKRYIATYEKSRVLVQLQPGIWFNKFLLGLEGFVSAGGDMINYGGGIRVGYRF